MTATSTSDYLLPVIYGSQGIVICLTNGLLLIAILRENSLRKRKEMLIIAGMAGADVIYGLGSMLLGIYRSYLLSQGEQNISISAWECISQSPLFVINIGVQLTSVMTVVVSVDRLLAVAWPIKYRALNERYAIKILAMIALYAVISLTAMFASTYFGTIPKLTKMCDGQAVSFWYSVFHATLIVVAGYTSVAIYIGVFIAYHRATRHQIAPDSTNDRTVALQRRLTVTLGIITVSTFLLLIIPFSINAVFTWTNIRQNQRQIALIGTITRFSTIINVMIYVFRQKEMRREMWALLTCTKTKKNTRLNAITADG